jgi:hypothetical protein
LEFCQTTRDVPILQRFFASQLEAASANRAQFLFCSIDPRGTECGPNHGLQYIEVRIKEYTQPHPAQNFIKPVIQYPAVIEQQEGMLFPCLKIAGEYGRVDAGLGYYGHLHEGEIGAVAGWPA